MWVTPCFGISSKILAGSTLRRQTLTPAKAATVQGKHQPLQWNIGRVQTYIGLLARNFVDNSTSVFPFVVLSIGPISWFFKDDWAGRWTMPPARILLTAFRRAAMMGHDALGIAGRA